MINIRLNDTWVASNPVCSQNPNAFILIIGNDKSIVPSVERNLSTVADAVRNGSPFQINLVPYEDFQIDDTIFQNLIQNSSGGGNTELLNRLLHYVTVGVIVVYQDNNIGSPLSPKQILGYTAP
jgi:hypothetical protein